MMGIVADLLERAVEPADDLLVDLVVEHVRHPPGALLLDPVADQVLVVVHRAGEELDRLIEQLLVPVARRHERQRPADDRRHARAAHAVHDHAVDELLHIVVLEHAHAARERRGGVPGHRPGVLGLAEPAGQVLGHVQRGQLLRHHLAAQEVARHEVAEVATDLVLPRRHDRRVRDRDA